MTNYPIPRPHERLDAFFGGFFREMRQAPPETYGGFLARAEEEFKRLGYREENSDGVENILIIRLDAIGDIILNSGFIRELRKNFPQAHITMVVAPANVALLELCPYINEVLAFDRNLIGINLHEILEKTAVFCRDKLWHRKFSKAFFTHCWSNNFHSVFLSWLSGARERIGYGTKPYKNWLGAPSKQDIERDNFLLTTNLSAPREFITDVEKTFYVLTASGLKVSQTHMELFYGAADFQRAKELLEDIPPACKKVVLGLGAGDWNRKYPVEKYLVALNELVKKNLVFVIVGGRNELDAANFVEHNLPPGKVVNLVGKTTLRETEAVIAQANFYLGNFTGVMHMAAAANVPLLAICRESQDRENVLTGVLSEFRRFKPWQTKSVLLRPAHPLDDCATSPPVYGHCRHPEPHCITQVTPQEIIDGFEKLMSMV